MLIKCYSLAETDWLILEWQASTLAATKLILAKCKVSYKNWNSCDAAYCVFNLSHMHYCIQNAHFQIKLKKTHSPNMCYDYHYNMHHNADVVKRELNRFNMFCGNDAPFILPSHITNDIYHCPPTELHNEVTYALNTPPSSAQDAQPTY